MCGICGWLSAPGTRPDLSAVRRMMDRLDRRGPDHEGSFSDGAMALGHRRLSILDLSFHGAQPMIDREQGLALAFNGTIYNHPELRQQLRALGHRFESTGDTEVILKAYAQWGADCVLHLTGMFAFAIWNMKTGSLFLARDRLGIKPLYYTENPRDPQAPLRFASSLPALLAGGKVNTDFDPIALHHQFTLHGSVPAPHTVFQGVRKLAPGSTLTVDAGGKKTQHRYWQINATERDDWQEAQWTEAIHAGLLNAVKKRLDISDVPVGVLLSGGLDSSLIVALAAEAGITPQTFTIGFEDQPEEKGSEFEFSDPVAARYGTQHHRFHIPNNQVLSRLPEAVAQMSEPMFAQDAVAFYLLSEQVAKEVKVVLSGQGADEVFGGYFWYPQMAAAQGTDIARFAPFYFDRDHDEFLDMVTAPFRGDDHTSARLSQEFSKIQGSNYINRVLGLDTSTLIVDDPVKRVDNMTMAWGLEARVPFLDHNLVELAMQMPAHLKLDGGGKGILKRIARGRIPDAVIDRPKGYFPVPALKYVRGPFFEFMRDILSTPTAQARGLFEPRYVNRLLAEPDQHFTRLQGSKLWHLAVFELWLQQNKL
ncbi:MAG: asparagine synthase (glutamine-hydrolyzing) [Halothiobacillus sp. 24-54-40]|jgi:asparagine synthase (glutamine-hydrolysing)|nr:MAG: asparagine synthase (glutamine-hydrolyzing) [Halothiobacillus sp. 35-54-62]OYZ88005.1 MAG: asparagine synthase (glutamine-hydrolyzing) [Halothiobacillus sp. 24-54-40]OZA80366.1 MAG: asparagine synthase (glutamine-hydrolyzing) [Halothiobacillus sp. 39-53-45]HQS02118.1 N-acetylglutaminylglutamine amidotransferase [Halothiobacillus sp.]HQS28928.1 N-acetylglutaminylglutamine amidotransferase [Halothiobacillus sp.]